MSTLPDEARVNRNLWAAKEYAKLGWKVFPVSPRSKHPITAHGFYDATDDLDQIKRWWEANPEAGVAIATGISSGLIVLDVDPRNGGDETLASLEAQYGEMEKTVESNTGGGGRHFFFEHPGEQMLPGLKGSWPGIDVKSDGGYVVVPYSVHPSGHIYRWRKGAGPSKGLPPLPDWIREILEDKRKSTVVPKQTADEDKSKKIKQGNRDNALTSLAGTMRRRGMSAEAILSALIAENDARCSPPLPEEDVRRIAASVMRYAPDQESDPSNAPPDVKSAFAGGQIKFLDTQKILDEDPPEIDWILDDRIAFGDVCLIAGPPGVGKSWVALEIAIAGAAGQKIMGYFSPTKRLKTMIIDEENPQDEVHRRIKKLAQSRQIGKTDLVGRLLVTHPRQGLTFHDKRLAGMLAKEIKWFQPDIIVIDSVIAASNIRDESDAVQVRRFFHDCIYPLQTICGSAVLAVHHTSKAIYQKTDQPAEEGMPRGSIDFMGAVDSALLLKPNINKKGHFIVSPIKVRRGERPENLSVEIVDGYFGGAFPLAEDPVAKAGFSKPSSKTIQGKIEKLVVKTLSDNGGEMLRQQVVRHVREQFTGVPVKTIRRAVDKMLEQGACERGEDSGKTYNIRLPQDAWPGPSPDIENPPPQEEF